MRTTLAELLMAGPMGARALDVLYPAAGVLDELHGKGTILRHLSPAGVVVDADEVVLVADPKPADSIDERPGELDDDEDDGGTEVSVVRAVWSAPEQDRGITSHRTDLYSFAAVAFKAVTGVPAWTTSTVADRDAGLTPRASDHLLVPAAVDTVFAAALALAPGDRPPSATELVAALRRSFGRRYHPPAGPRLRRLVAATAVAAVAGVAAAASALAATGWAVP